MTENSYSNELRLPWLTCSICGMTDPTVKEQEGKTLHPDAKTCMNRALKAPLSVTTGDRFQGREPERYTLDAEDEDAIAAAVLRWHILNAAEEPDDLP